MSKITNVEAYQILDSWNNPTVEVKITTNEGIMGVDSVPSGKSTGTYEALTVDPTQAVLNINKNIAPKINSLDPTDQENIDNLMIELDGTKNKSDLGANSILGVSLAAARVAALSQRKHLYKYLNELYFKINNEKVNPEIPKLMMVMIEGGKHAQNNLCIQEFLILTELGNGHKIWQQIKEILNLRKIEPKLGAEGGFAPQLNFDEDAIKIIIEAVKKINLKIPEDVKLGLDICGNNCKMSNDDIVKMMEKWPIFSLEDPLSEDDWEKWSKLKMILDQLNREYLLIGDDLFVTNNERLNQGIKTKAANGIIIKLNQIGTLTETLKVICKAKNAGFTHIVSHRAGETMDSFIADLAVATGAKYLKSGAPLVSERLVKYNRLDEIKGEL